MAEGPNTVLLSPPVVRDGEIHRGVAATDRLHLLLPMIDRAKWVLLSINHGASFPWPHPEYDLYLTDPCYGGEGGRPQVSITPRDFTDEDVFRPLGLEKLYDIVFNACWVRVKRPELLVEALTFARDRGRPISCLWFGYHWHPEGPELERGIVAEVEARGLAVDFLSTHFNREEVNRRFNLARLAVLCSYSEAGPRVMSEAMLADVPYVTTGDTRGGSPAWVCDRNGRTCAPAPEELAGAIWHVLDRASSYDPRAWALEHMCHGAAIRRLRAALADLAARKGWRVNLDDLRFRRIDWGGQFGDVPGAEAACRP
jgi:glycosyltransferase involved in cell wall biosynthesis